MTLQVAATYFDYLDVSLNNYGYIIACEDFTQDDKVVTPSVSSDHYVCCLKSKDIHEIVKSGALENHKEFQSSLLNKTRRNPLAYDFNGVNPILPSLDALGKDYSALIASRHEYDLQLFHLKANFGEEKSMHTQVLHSVTKPRDNNYNFETKMWVFTDVVTGRDFLDVSLNKKMNFETAMWYVTDFMTNPKLSRAFTGRKEKTVMPYSVYVVGNLSGVRKSNL